MTLHLAESTSEDMSARGVAVAAGFCPIRLRRIKAVMGRWVDDGAIPGFSAVVSRGGRTVLDLTMGLQDPITGAAMRPDSVFRIYSMTKPIVSAAAMALVEAGRMKLTDPVTDYLPAFADLEVLIDPDDDALRTEKAVRPIRIIDLFRHTAGFTHGVFGATPLDAAYRRAGIPDEEATNAELVARLARLPLKHQPQTVWEYGRSTDVLGHLLEVVSGAPLSLVLQHTLLGPLGMVDTGFHAPADRVVEPFPDDHELAELPYIDVSRPPRFEAAGEGLVSTPRDYARFCQMILNGGVLGGERVLGRKTVELMLTDVVGDFFDRGTWWLPGDGHGFSLGFGIRRPGPRTSTVIAPLLGSEGECFWAGNAGTYFWIDPRERLTGVFMMQSCRHLLRAIDQFKTLVLQAIVD